MEEALLDGLIDAKNQGFQADNGWKASGWKKAYDAVVVLCGEFPLTMKQVKDKANVYNKIWKTWLDHERATSGWSKDEHGVLYNDPDVEDAYFAEHKDRSRFRRALPPYYDRLLSIYGDRAASGRYAEGMEEEQDPELTEEDSEGRELRSSRSSSLERSQGGAGGRQRDNYSQSLRKRALSNATSASKGQRPSNKKKDPA